MTVTTSLPQAPRADTRELRALRLFEERGHEIVRTGPWTYLVPSRSGSEPRAVDYRRESCDCPDHERRGATCVHIFAVGIHRAKRRRPAGL